MSPTLTVGVPVYNGECYLEQALNSLLKQSFTDFVMVISDNASTDRTAEICRKFADADPRIQYHRQPQLIPGPQNFHFVLTQAKTEFFMWAACDDVWAPTFVEKALARLNNSGRSLAFTGLINIDSHGQKIRSYPQVPTLDSPLTSSAVWRYLRQLDYNGKANLIYGITRTQLLKDTYLKMKTQFLHYGGDMVVVYALMLGGGITIVPEVLFQKRIALKTDREGTPQDLDQVAFHISYIDYKEYLGYLHRYWQVSQQAGWRIVPALALFCNLLWITSAKLKNKFARLFKKPEPTESPS